ncbi:hypothetical protein A3F58_04170 [Candidatus Roizmanbacteria bacterium RIFCSPHIGHO2_12_FULL_37_9b]|uniref:Glutaredoxin domain-containing protein n=1 Tax=Candidatus Roizmanbacteria bacterium RIFCSPHIGHO2_02_FULL_38_11 TaxID=1802039 RepID=A0A1F7H182_9BACT|nr:MAG: hypothetical protein A3C25_02405 [Candidatus Roizmanbacteria bacterium RIFCSPHIGHO2_02_FULL_38_11]OGK34726.1 MAG: hypothetical protein A3F58_04170 [Candidatus Roizmanbacteria bacterium RIFCSPHIGHO2_12_FULL_37_9b]
MKITVYTVTDCQFSKQEIEYLKTKNLQFEEKNLETNKDFLTEMLAVGDNFAGTPLTRIEKDDGQSIVLKGFTQSEFDEALGFKLPVSAKIETASPASTPVNVQPEINLASTTPPPPPQTTPSQTTPAEPTVLESPPIPTVIEPPTQSIQQPSSPPITEQSAPVIPDVQPSVPTPQDEKLNSLLNDLQSKSAPNEPARNASQSDAGGNSPSSNDVNTQNPASPNMPSIPDPKFT